jgi:hypothetical protein
MDVHHNIVLMVVHIPEVSANLVHIHNHHRVLVLDNIDKKDIHHIPHLLVLIVVVAVAD